VDLYLARLPDLAALAAASAQVQLRAGARAATDRDHRVSSQARGADLHALAIEVVLAAALDELGDRRQESSLGTPFRGQAGRARVGRAAPLGPHSRRSARVLRSLFNKRSTTSPATWMFAASGATYGAGTIVGVESGCT
jgi:hypothetical protein